MTRSWRPSGIRARRLLLALTVLVVSQPALLGDVRGGGPRLSPVASSSRIQESLPPPARVLVPVSTPSSGRVVAVGAAEGQYVRNGAVLLQLDVAPARRALAEVQTRLARARADADRAAAALTQRERAASADTSLAVRQLEQTADLRPHAPGGTRAGDLSTERALGQAQRDMAVAAHDVLRAARARAADARAPGRGASRPTRRSGRAGGCRPRPGRAGGSTARRGRGSGVARRRSAHRRPGHRLAGPGRDSGAAARQG